MKIKVGKHCYNLFFDEILVYTPSVWLRRTQWTLLVLLESTSIGLFIVLLQEYC